MGLSGATIHDVCEAGGGTRPCAAVGTLDARSLGVADDCRSSDRCDGVGGVGSSTAKEPADAFVSLGDSSAVHCLPRGRLDELAHSNWLLHAGLGLHGSLETVATSGRECLAYG
ncbi:hypothetical protein GN958_ATG13615 [Phytophthora infestans]|uniref:Uncharacterized protein n=1 Tax=Phytophthora infestans TaxID=4787 RepID=A0A8S9UCJ0_PHYIN|nr:hypothetical protein GN958_ATG13615 [Phytophthora infestans]